MSREKEIKLYSQLLEFYKDIHKMDLVVECQEKLKQLNEKL